MDPDEQELREILKPFGDGPASYSSYAYQRIEEQIARQVRPVTPAIRAAIEALEAYLKKEERRNHER